MMCGEKIPEKDYDEFVIDTMLLKHLCNLISSLKSFNVILDITNAGWEVKTVNAEHTMMGFFSIPKELFKIYSTKEREIQMEFYRIANDIENFKYKKYPDTVSIKVKEDKFLITDGFINRERQFPDESIRRPTLPELDFTTVFAIDSEFVKRACKAYEDYEEMVIGTSEGYVSFMTQGDDDQSIAKSPVKSKKFESKFKSSYVGDMIRFLDGKVEISTGTEMPMMIMSPKPFPTVFFASPRTSEEVKDEPAE